MTFARPQHDNTPPEMSFSEFLTMVADDQGQTPSAAQIEAAPVKVERRKLAGCRELEYLMLLAAIFFTVFFGLGAAGVLTIEPFLKNGDYAVRLLMGIWSLGLGCVAACLLCGIRKHRQAWMCESARAGAMLWFAMWIATILPGHPVMAWGFCPLMVLIHARVYLIMCNDDC